MASKPEDQRLPHDCLHVRVVGSTLVAQPYIGSMRSGRCLLVDLVHGKVVVPDKVLDISTGYLRAYAFLGVQLLGTSAAAIVVTGAERVATLWHGAPVYRVTKTTVLTANGKPPADKEDIRLLALLKLAVDPLGAAPGLYFSPEQNLTARTQAALAADANRPLWQRGDSDFWWNAALSEPLCAAEAHRFIIPAILGFVRQIEGAPVAAGVKAETLTVTLIARRSRHRMGTRHWRRGIDARGAVANFVETEQIVATSGGDVAAHVQVRGSIPAAWSQVPNTRYKPPTVIGDIDACCREPFVAQARYLASRYGAVVAVNLSNSHGSEGRLGAAFEALVAALAPDAGYSLVPFDFHKECGKTNYQNLSRLWDQLAPSATAHGMLRFAAQRGDAVAGRKGHAGAAPSADPPKSQQTGVLRTNCIDCLDRTNVVQAYFAREALATFLRGQLLLDQGAALATTYPTLERALKIMWADHGDALSLQYAGTGALKAGFTRTGRRTMGGLADDGAKSGVRYYLNNFEDGRKQDALDLVTGAFRPRRDPIPKAAAVGSGSAWVLLSALLAILSVSSAVTAPFSRRITLLRSALPLLCAAALVFAIVLARGKKATCRPLLRPDQVQFWLHRKAL